MTPSKRLTRAEKREIAEDLVRERDQGEVCDNGAANSNRRRPVRIVS